MKTKITLLFLTLILYACSTGVSTPRQLPAQDDRTNTPHTMTDAASELGPPKIIATVGTPNIGQPPDGAFPTHPASQQDCAFIWTYREHPELTNGLDASIKALIPNASSRAAIFGEDCVAADGQTVRFLPMQTDFYVTVSVETLDDYETFGNWIYEVMQVVDGFPPEDLAGLQLGFVEFRFEKSVSESIGFRVPIQGYDETAGGKSGEELFCLYYTGP